ncbi:BTAD domain-containing putative transcriptional regulator [Actinoplanes sp. HUAS TT8]|uniref:AfsR/SARP family transcriptional regulator n=1 Tax=Actinoplanes sp. HUAS TT8 TaxID=3447453 RepID=UPI003F51E7B0
MTPVRLCVFGGLRMWRSGIEVPIGSVRVRTVLAVLLAARGATVSVAELVDTLWGERPSASAVNQVQRLIGQVRRLFEPELPNRETGEWLLPVGEGYRLRQDARTSDLMAFFDLVSEAKKADAALKLEQALTLGQHQPFAGLPAEVLDRPVFTAIEAARTQVAVHGADVALSEPGAQRLLPLLITYGQAAPYHEPLQARLIRLLAAAGRRAEALTRFETVRQQLAEDLGADPGLELQAAHREALAEPSRPDPTRPAQLPLRVAAFSPRDDLTAALDAGREKGVVVLSGMGGAGKTTLAVDWAHRIADDFPDGQLYLDLRGFSPGGRQLRPAEALTTLLRSMGASAHGDDDPDELGARFRSMVATRRMIIVLDNARDSAQVRPLLPGAPGCLAVITSRNRMPGLVAREGAWPVNVGRLSRRAARDMLARRLGTRRTGAEPAATDLLVEICAGLPLALSIAAARIAVSPQENLTDVVADLKSAGHRLDALDTGEEHDSVRAAFSWSYAVLSESAKRLFRLLAVYPSQVVSADTAASIAGADVRAELNELSVTTMLTPLGGGRYTAHDLLQAYAAELLDGGQDDRDQAERRLVEHYVHASRNAYLTFQLLLPPEPGPPPPGVFPPVPGDSAAAHLWYSHESAAVSAVTEFALRRGWARSAALILVQVRPMRTSQPEPRARLRWQAKRAVEAVAELDDPELETLILREAAILDRAHAPDRAREYLERALAIAERRADLIGQAQILRNLARPEFSSTGQMLDYVQRAVVVAREAGDISVLVYALLWQATILEENGGDLTLAATAADEAVELAVKAGMEDAHRALVVQRSCIAQKAGDNEAAIRLARWALDHGLPGDEMHVFNVTLVLALAWHNSGAVDDGRAAAQRVRAMVHGREAIFAEVTGPDWFADAMAKIDAVLAGDATAHHGQ